MAIELVKMIRSAEEANGGPTEADVHPNEVENYALAGFVVASAGVGEPAGKPGGKEKPLSAAELIEKIKAAATPEEVDAILGEDKRATVVQAAADRKAELTKPAE